MKLYENDKKNLIYIRLKNSLIKRRMISKCNESEFMTIVFYL